MLWSALFVSVLCSVSGFSFPKPNSKCDLKESPCITNIIREMFTLTLPGIAELGVVPTDPLHQDLMEQNTPGFEFALSDSIVVGFKDSILNKVNIIEENNKKSMVIDMTLPNYEMSGNYKMNGKIISLPVTGEGKYTFHATNIHMVTTANTELYENNGKQHLKLTNIETKTELLGTIKFNADNLFNGNHNLGDEFLKSINDKPKEVAAICQELVANTNANTIIGNFNNIFGVVPINELATGY